MFDNSRAEVKFARVSKLLTSPVYLPGSANHRARATDKVTSVRNRLARRRDPNLSFGRALGRHVRIGRNRDGGKVPCSKPFRINHFASVSAPQNTLCLAWGAKPFPRTPPRPLVNASLLPQPRNWPHFRHFRVSPFGAESRLNRQPCAPATFAGGRFSPSLEGNQELVNGIARVVQPQAGRSENEPLVITVGAFRPESSPLQHNGRRAGTPRRTSLPASRSPHRLIVTSRTRFVSKSAPSTLTEWTVPEHT